MKGTFVLNVAIVFIIGGWWQAITESIILNGKCGFPGKPYRTKTDVDLKGQYEEGEEVSYQCIDYRNYLQVRRCFKGKWAGLPLRCPDVVKYVWLRDVEISDLTNPLYPRSIQSVKNLNLTLGVWRFPNAFTNSRSPEATFLVNENRLYRWRLTFNDTFIKSFIHINFNVHNYTTLEPEVKQAFRLDVSLDVGPHRNCSLAAQTYDTWKIAGRKVENFFECDANSQESYLAEVDNKTNEMVMYTQSSINITYEMIAIMLGSQYGTTAEPICGEPEYSISQVSHFNQEFRDYSFICKTNYEYQAVVDDTKLTGTSVHFQRCRADMFWEGKYPICVPRESCSIEDLLREKDSKETIDNSIEIYQLDGLYFVNDSIYYAIEGTVATYGCVNTTSAILVGKEKRTCHKNGTWSSLKPTCKDPNLDKSRNTLLLIIIGSSFLVLVVIIILLLMIARHFMASLKESMETQQAQTLAVNEMMGLYDNPEIDLTDGGIYENYADIENNYSKLGDSISGIPPSEGGAAPRYNVYQTPQPLSLDDSYIDWRKDVAVLTPDYYVTRQETSPQQRPSSSLALDARFYHNRPPSERTAQTGDVDYLEMVTAAASAPPPKPKLRKLKSEVIYGNNIDEFDIIELSEPPMSKISSIPTESKIATQSSTTWSVKSTNRASRAQSTGTVTKKTDKNSERTKSEMANIDTDGLGDESNEDDEENTIYVNYK